MFIFFFTNNAKDFKYKEYFGKLLSCKVVKSISGFYQIENKTFEIIDKNPQTSLPNCLESY